jgi:hypothetical protein
MLRVLWVFVVVLGLTAPALAAPVPVPPVPVPPGNFASLSTSAVASVDRDKQTVVCQYTTTVPVHVTEYRTVERIIEVQGMKRTVTEAVPVTVTKMVTQTRAVAWSARGGKAIDGLGKPLSWDEVVRRLQPNSAVFTGTGTEVDPRHLKLFKPETVILLSPDPASTPVDVPVPVPLPQGVPVPMPVPVP